MVMSTDGDEDLAKLRCFFHGGFPEIKSQMPPSIQPYWRVRDMLTEHGGIVYMGGRTVLPESLRETVLSTIHSAHQGTTSMSNEVESREEHVLAKHGGRYLQHPQSLHIIWCSVPQSISRATHNASSTYLLYMLVAGHNFCLVVDRFSNWLQVYTGKGWARNLVYLLGESFHSFGIPESLTCGVHRSRDILHRKTSVGFPHPMRTRKQRDLLLLRREW